MECGGTSWPSANGIFTLVPHFLLLHVDIVVKGSGGPLISLEREPGAAGSFSPRSKYNVEPHPLLYLRTGVYIYYANYYDGEGGGGEGS